MLVLLINLARRPDRLAFMVRQLSELGQDFERIDAVDCRNGDFGPDTPFITGPERACAQSHRRAWARVLESDESHGLILEDDVILTSELTQFLAAPERLPADAEIVRLETRLQTTALGRGRASALPARKLHRLFSAHDGCAAYIVTRSFARRALQDLTDFKAPVDNVLFHPESTHHYAATAYQLRPALCLQLELVHPEQPGPLARSDLEAFRRARYPDYVPGVRGPRVKRPLSEKCIRELARWARRGSLLAEKTHARLLHGRAARGVPFSGTVLPSVATALSLSGSEQALQLEVPALRLLGADG